jgi:hypothetical protein
MTKAAEYECDFCGVGFETMTTLKQHYVEKHRDKLNW